jgi:hypothetical protein
MLAGHDASKTQRQNGMTQAFLNILDSDLQASLVQ